MPNTQFSVSILDYSGEKSTAQGPIVNLAADGANFAAILTARDAFIAALQNVTLGTVAGQTISYIERETQVEPVDPNAQRERKWLVVAEDVTAFLDAPANTIPNPGHHKLYTYEFPCADADLLQGNRDELFPHADAANPQAAVDAFIDAFEAFYRSPTLGVLAVRRITKVGRNL